MLAATATEFAEFQAVGRGLLILGRYVVPALACLTLKHNVIAWHRLTSKLLIHRLRRFHRKYLCNLWMKLFNHL